MRKYITITSVLFILLFSACVQKDIMIDDFESGTFDKWTVEGNAFGDTPNQPNRNEINLEKINGRYIADSYGDNDDLVGLLTSKEFRIERNYINFMIGGGAYKELYIELLVDGETVAVSRSIRNSGTLNNLSWDVKGYKGKPAIIRIVDNAVGSWGHILVDNIYQSNKDASTLISDYQLTYDMNSNYLLIPIEDKAPEMKIQLTAGDDKIGEPMNIRLANTNIDYFVPIDISKFRNKKITLNFPYVNKESVGIANISLSDNFEIEYNETYRPSYHFTANHGWINDPNGMVYYNGEYHLYYQYNPYGSRWGNMHWGHAVSKDLVTWKQLPYGIAPDSLGSIFSGSAVIDKKNTSGFGENALIAIYTSAGRIQTQSIAYSHDDGRTFIKFDGNPVLSDLEYPDFRDPKVFWHDKSDKWIMSLATGQTITFYGSKDLKKWDRLSEFGEGIGSHNGVWECPDLFHLTYNGVTKWILFVSNNPGGPNGGSATQYFIGDFDGTTFKADKLPYPIWLDYGRDNYAGVTWSNINESDGRKLFIGWMNNWDYANDIPPINFRGAMTLPREMKLVHNGKHLIIANPPVEEVNTLRGKVKKIAPFSVDKTYEIENLTEGNNGTYEIEMQVETGNSDFFNFELRNKKGEKVIFNFDFEKGIFSVDRSLSGIVDFNKNFSNKKSIAPLSKKGSYYIRLFVDKASTEIFIDNGELVQTNTLFPTEPYNTITFESSSEVKINTINLYPIR